MVNKLSKQDLQWQAEGDARVMAQYQEIMQDKQRMNRAIKEANKQAQDLSKRASAMRSAAGLKASSSRTGSRMSGRKK
jgi:hypothetical protein